MRKDARLVLSSDQSKSRPVKVSVELLSTGQKLAESARRAAVFTGLALVSVFVPVLHFILVPVFLVVALVAAWKGFRARARLAFSEPETCLGCGASLKPVHVLQDEPRLTCEKCFSAMRVELPVAGSP